MVQKGCLFLLPLWHALTFLSPSRSSVSCGTDLEIDVVSVENPACLSLNSARQL